MPFNVHVAKKTRTVLSPKVDNVPPPIDMLNSGSQATQLDDHGDDILSHSSSKGTGDLVPTKKKGLWVDIEHGKVKTDWLSDENTRPSENHTWMTWDEFTTFKNAGKLTASNKYTDKKSGKTYFSKDKKRWFSDEGMKNKVNAKDVPTHDLLNRTRKDRTNEYVSLYDVSYYKDQVRHQFKNDKMEHDHVVAGESIRRRVLKERGEHPEPVPKKKKTTAKKTTAKKPTRKKAPPKKTAKKTPKKKATDQPTEPEEEFDEPVEEPKKLGFKFDLPGRKHCFNERGMEEGEDWAYENAPSIEISEDDHKRFSPTYGGRQKKSDILVDGTGKQLHKLVRPEMDAELPGPAFHRDVDTMLTQTQGRDNQLQQLGAYRKLYKNNVKLGNISPDSPAFHAIKGKPLEKGGLTWQQDKNGRKQGQETDGMFRRHLRTRLGRK